LAFFAQWRSPQSLHLGASMTVRLTRKTNRGKPV
jgi:hypothetical protein